MALATLGDVVARLGRPLSEAEEERVDPGLLDEATALVVGYLGCDPTDSETHTVPPAVAIVTSRMVARVLTQAEAGLPFDSATSGASTAGPFTQQRNYQSGSTTGAPWLGAADKTALKPFKCSGDAFSIDTAPRRLAWHSETCSANAYANLPWWQAYCDCGADIAGFPLYGG